MTLIDALVRNEIIFGKHAYVIAPCFMSRARAGLKDLRLVDVNIVFQLMPRVQWEAL